MRNMLIILGLLAVGAFICAPVMAQSQSLYEQEGVAGVDGYEGINAAGQAPDAATANTTNWKYQYGGGTFSAIYGSGGWIHEVETGDSTLDIECDIEMYYSESFENNKIYIHIGDPVGATDADRTAFVDGSFSSNNGQYLGVSFLGTNKTAADMEQDVDGYTGVVKDAMVASRDTWRELTGDNAASFDIKLSMSWDGGSIYHRPVNYGDGSHGTVTDTLWWLVDDGGIGTYPISIKVEMLFEGDQPDGNYNFDPAMVASPVM